MKTAKIFSIISLILFSVIGASILSFATGLPLLPIAGVLAAAGWYVKIPSGSMAVALFDLARPTGNNVGAGGGLDTEIILLNAADVDMSNFPARSADGITISSDIPMKDGKYMHRFYMTQGTIKPTQKKLKGANKDSGGYEIGVEGFYPGLELAVQKWIANFGFAFEGFVIIQNCAGSVKYLLGEPCNLISVDDLESMWGEEVDKEKGTKFIFKGKQSQPMSIYSGAVTYDPGSSSW